MKKRINYFILFCFLIIQKGITQNYFSQRYNFYNQNNLTQQFILINDTLYLPVNLLGSYEGMVGKIAVNNGNSIITSKYACSFPNSYYYPYHLVQHNAKIYTTGGGGYYNNISSPLYKYNYNGDTLSTYLYGDTTYYGLMQRMIASTTQKDKILLIGASDSTCGVGHQGLYKIMIREVDTNGVLYRTKLLLNDCKYRSITDVDTTENKGYLIGYAGDYTTWQVDSRVIKLDSNLNIVWNAQINITSGGAPAIANHQNQYYTVISSKVDSVWNFTYKWARASLTRLDLNGNIVWQKYYGVKERPMLTAGLKECANGDYIACGSHFVGAQLKGWIMRTDSSGNLKWWRNYSAQTTPVQDTIAQNYLYDIMELPNGDIAAVGTTDGSSISPLQQTWLLKVDSNGCFGAGNCNVNIATSVNELKEENSFSVFPNPVSQMLNVQLSMFNDKTEIKITDVLGKTIIQQINITQQKTEIDVSSLSKGIYFLSLYQNNRLIGTKKIIKE